MIEVSPDSGYPKIRPGWGGVKGWGQESGVRSQESGVRRQESEGAGIGAGPRDSGWGPAPCQSQVEANVERKRERCRIPGVWPPGRKPTRTFSHCTGPPPRSRGPERYGLTTEIRRCAASIPANIAEATGRRVGPDGRRFYEIAAGSAAELEYHLLLARDLGLLSSEAHQRLQLATTEIKRMLAGLIRSQRAREER
jgi:four helix bundle protein